VAGAGRGHHPHRLPSPGAPGPWPVACADGRRGRPSASAPTDRHVPPARGTKARLKPSRSALAFLGHLAVVSLLFEAVLFRHQVFYFRDIGTYYYPNYVFLARSFAQGVWPLWNPTSDAGAPFLMANPADLLLVRLLGAEGALRFAPPLHVLLGMCGVTVLARRLAIGSMGAWAAGLFYGLSGYVLSTVNLFELHHAVSWAPWVIAAYLGYLGRPTARSAAALAAVAAIQLSTLSAEVVLQTALFALVLTSPIPRARTWVGLGLAGGLAALLTAPVSLGVRGLVEGTRRAAGFDPSVSFSWSVHPVALLDLVFPRWFGDPHSFGDVGYWGQPFFPDGYPYLVGLYLGPAVLLLAARAGKSRLWLLAALGVVLALGSFGPAAGLMTPLMRSLRSPVKFLFLSTLALCVLAGRGVERGRASIGWLASALAAGLALAGFGLLLARRLSPLLDPRAGYVAKAVWPESFAVAGVLLMCLAIAVRGGPRLASAAVVLAGLDLLIVNGRLNPSAEPSFYELRPAVRAMVQRAAAQGPYRWFSYGVADSPGLTFAPAMAAQKSDVWLYYLERQSLLPRTNVLDGVDAAFDEDRVGWAPPLAALSPSERIPARYPSYHERLRLAGVRWVLSYFPLPAGLLTLRDTVEMPELARPLLLYELNQPLPRAFWAPSPESNAATQRAGGSNGSVAYERLDPHTIRLRSSGLPGYVLVVEGYHRHWRVEGPEGPVAAVQANGRYCAFPTPGGDRTYTMRYEPPWRRPALGLAGLGAAVTLALLFRRGRSVASGSRCVCYT
jgi:hypothetical protein